MTSMPRPPENLNEFQSLVQLIADLRGPDGCPWDKEQTHTTLTPYAIEETFEMVEAIESGDDAEICEELGDVLFQVVLHAQLASERKAFTMNDVVYAIASKLVRRHPHVFSGLAVHSMQDIFDNWEQIKASEKANKKPQPVNYFKIPSHTPALQYAHKIGEKTEKYDFDFNDPAQVLAQLKAEIQELEQAIAEKNQQHIEHEMGDVLFSAAQLARHLKVEPETALRKTNARFISRFNKMVESCQNSIEQFTQTVRAQKEFLWKQAKK